jgi:AcrR family transcriptional regulator
MAPKPLRSKKAGPPKRREREVLDAAVEVFARNGYSDASVQDVADAVGILKGSLYHYIDSKDDLLFRLLVEVHDDVETILTEVQATEGLEPLARLSEYVRCQVEYNLAHLDRISIYYHDIDHLSEGHRTDLYGRRRVHEHFVTDLIREAQKQGAAGSDIDARIAANFVFGTIIWVYRWYRPKGRVAQADLARMCASFVCAGVAAGVTAPPALG